MVLQSFINENLWDEVRVEIGNKPINGNVKAPVFNGELDITDSFVVDGNRIITIRK